MKRLALLALLVVPTPAAAGYNPRVSAAELFRNRDGNAQLTFRLDKPLEFTIHGTLSGTGWIAKDGIVLFTVDAEHYCYGAIGPRAKAGERLEVELYTSLKHSSGGNTYRRKMTVKKKTPAHNFGTSLGC